jgi:hypothetical protein
METEAREAAAKLINRHVASDCRILDMSGFLTELTAALKTAREKGQVDVTGEIGRSGLG